MKRDDYKVKDTMIFEESQEDSINSIIDNIFDDFESRTCENCKYNKEQDDFMIFCDKEMCQDGSKMMWHSFTKDFCCNKWEIRDEK